MGACSQEAATLATFKFDIVLYKVKNKDRVPKCSKRPKRSKPGWKEKGGMCSVYIPTEESFQKVKRLYNLCTCVCAPGAEHNWTWEEMGGEDGVISSVCLCFRRGERWQPLPRLWMHVRTHACVLYVSASLTRDIITLSSLSKSSSSSSSRSSTACWCGEEKEKKETCLCNRYSGNRR